MAMKVLLLIPLFYFLVLLETSFWLHLPIVLISIMIINIFFSRLALPSSLVGGFFSDIFSANFITYHILVFLALSFFVQFFLKRYVRTPI